MRGFGFTIAVLCIIGGIVCFVLALTTLSDELGALIVWLAGSLLFLLLARWTLVTTGRQR